MKGLEPVRRRPGMYIGGTDEKAMHHLFAEVLDNAMDEAVAGHASFIEVALEADGTLCVIDNGRGIPVDPHPKYPGKSALEVVMTTLHSGGKFNSNVYSTSGGLHGVGVSVVNALSEHLEVEVALGGRLYRQTFSRGAPQTRLEDLGVVRNRRGTTVRFRPDPEIFKERAQFKPLRIFKMARAKAYLFGGVEIRWSCAPELLPGHGCAREGGLPFPRRPQGLPHVAHRGIYVRHEGRVRGPRTKGRRPWQRRMGHRLARRRGRLHAVLLQHRADAGRRHARARPCARRCRNRCAPMAT